LNRPALLTLPLGEGGEAYALLTGLRGDTATLQAGDTSQSVPLAALAERWRGEFATFWRAPPGYDDRRVEGGTGPLAEWLSARLAQVQGRPPAGAPEVALRSRIYAFQLAQGLAPDGLAGPLTFMQLNRALGVDELWDDAENIINLATLNDEDETPLRPPSPISPDIFGEDRSPNNHRISIDERRDSSARRSLSNPATPPFSRPRGESLMQAKSFLQTIHQNRGGEDSSPAAPFSPPREKLPFDTQDLRDLVTRAGVITRALKEIVRKAEGVAVSPQRRPQK
ncbi:MAG: hypothetical protein M1823_006754, partial [Watsoniomyces obsoletus]